MTFWYDVLNRERSNFNMWSPILLKLLRYEECSLQFMSDDNNLRLFLELLRLNEYISMYISDSLRYTTSMRYILEKEAGIDVDEAWNTVSD